MVVVSWFIESASSTSLPAAGMINNVTLNQVERLRKIKLLLLYGAVQQYSILEGCSLLQYMLSRVPVCLSIPHRLNFRPVQGAPARVKS